MPGMEAKKPQTKSSPTVASAGLLEPSAGVTEGSVAPVTACVLALGCYLLGNESVAVYDGSWAEGGGRQED